MVSDFESDLSTPRRSRIALSSKIKDLIREAIGKCEYCDTKTPPGSLEVYTLGMLSRSPHRPAENPANVIIVLCQEHHVQACEGRILKSSLKSKIVKRPDKIKRTLRSLLEKHDRTYEGSNIKEVHDPDRFGVGAFLQRRPERRS